MSRITGYYEFVSYEFAEYICWYTTCHTRNTDVVLQGVIFSYAFLSLRDLSMNYRTRIRISGQRGHSVEQHTFSSVGAALYFSCTHVHTCRTRRGVQVSLHYVRASCGFWYPSAGRKHAYKFCSEIFLSIASSWIVLQKHKSKRQIKKLF